MVNRKTLAPALLSALVISAPVMAVAQQTTRPAAAEPEVKAEQASKAQLKAFETAKVRIAGAIAAAEKHAGGGKVIDVLFDAGAGKPHFKVKTYQNNAVWEGTVDAASGQVVDAGTTTPENKLDAEDKAELTGLQKATTTLAQAVATAEKSGGGNAIGAGLEETNGKIVYEVSVVKNGAVQKIVIDPTNGKIVS